MRTRSKRTPKLAVLLAVLAYSVFLLSDGALAGKGANKGGGHGGGGGDDPLTNPAFVYEDTFDGGLFLTTSDGVDSQQLTKAPRKGSDRSAVWSPDGTQIAFLRYPDDQKQWNNLFTIKPDGSGLTLIRTFDDWPPPTGRLAWSPNGSTIVYAAGAQDSELWAVDTSTGNLQLVYEPTSLFHVSQPDFSPDFDLNAPGYQGTLAFRAMSDPEFRDLSDPDAVFQFDIWLLDVQIDQNGQVTSGNLRNLTDSTIDQELPAWSPDGQFLAFVDFTAFDNTFETDIIVLDLITEFSWTVATNDGVPSQPDWSPDGQYVGYSASREVDGSVTHDIFRVSPWDLSAPIVNVTGTDSWRDREVNPRWNPAWVNDIDA